MDLLDIGFLAITALCTSMLTAVVGAGGGTILIAVMLQFMAPAAAIPVHGVIHFVSNGWRSWLFRRHMAWPLIVRFGLLLPFGAAFGLWLFQGMSAETVQLLIGCFIVVTLFTRQMKRLRTKELPLWAFVPLGFVTGALNMIVGVIAPVLGVLVIRKDLDKEAVVGTLGFFGFIGNTFKVAGFALIGFSVIEYGPVLLAMVPAVIVGTSIGKKVLGRFNETAFQILFRAVLLLLAVKLILTGGFGFALTDLPSN